MTDLVEHLTQLRAATLRQHPELSVDTPQAQQALRDSAAADLAAAHEVRVLDGGTRGGVVLLRSESRFLGNAQRCRIDVALDDGEAIEWVAAQLLELAPHFDVTFELQLDVCHSTLLPHLERCGLTPRMTWLNGRPDDALMGLRAAPINRTALGEGIRIEALANPLHIDAIVALLQAYSEREPGTGALSPHVPITSTVRARMEAFARESLTEALGHNTTVVMLSDDEVVGYGAYHPRHDPIMGHVGGLALALDPSAQGRGLSKIIYEWLLERMAAAGVQLMRGRTANPAVLHLAARMKRPVRGWQLEPASPQRSVATTPKKQPNNPLHGVTLKMILEDLVSRRGWADLGSRIKVRCFTHDPSMKSSLKFLRKTDWARSRLERLYLQDQRHIERRRTSKANSDSNT